MSSTTVMTRKEIYNEREMSMKHLGDITAIDWSKVEPVDVVTKNTVPGGRIMAKKPNRNSPATPEQCVAAHERGVSEGTAEGLAIYLTVMRDKFGKSTDAAYNIYKRTGYECDAVKLDGHIIARYERELRELIKCDICPQMKNIAKAYKQPKQPIKVKDVDYSRRQGREAGWQFATMVFLLAIRKEWRYTKIQLLRVYAAACETRESIREKYINVPDLESVLLEEGKIKVV